MTETTELNYEGVEQQPLSILTENAYFTKGIEAFTSSKIPLVEIM